MKNAAVLVSLSALLALASAPRIEAGTPPETERFPDGIALHLPETTVRIRVCDERTLRITVSRLRNQSFAPGLSVIRQWQPASWKFFTEQDRIRLSTGRIQAIVDRRTGSIAFFDRAGKLLVAEHPKRPHEIVPATVAGEEAYHVTQRWILAADEGIYGLGQFEDGTMNYRNHHVTLIQNNRHVVVPFIASSRSYGILWNNASHSEFADGADGMSLWSEVADGIDYYLIAGTSLDDVIAGLRDATGRAPLWPVWGLGYWQSKERYESQDELMSVAREYRRRHIPVDNIVLDWQYWGNLGWNAMDFDRSSFPDPAGMIDSLHRLYNLKLMISIWPQVDSATAVFKELSERGYLFPTEIWNGGKTYDAYSREARDIYWNHLNRGLYSRGVDAWWVDATEPDWKWCDSLLEEKEGILKNGMTAAGSSARYLNTYPLVTTTGIYENQRATNPARRVVMLTRSAFTGQQRNSTAIWSGDISSNWKTFRNQIAAGINFSLAGIPYWNSDIGGFLPKEFGGEYPLGPRDPAYRELYVRWFQFGAFCPVFRAHGTDFPRELWRFGEPGDWAYDALLKYVDLRYRLLPYLYSTAWQVTHSHSTFMRGLPMDFPDDPNVLSLGTEYMFGAAFLVAPVTRAMYFAKQRGTTVPASAFMRTGGSRGLDAQYFAGMKFDTLRFSRTDSLIRFNWMTSGLPEVGKTRFSARWTGKIKPPESGRYEFEAISDDGVNLFVGGRQLMDEMYFGGRQMNVADVELNSDSLYDFVFEYYQEKEGAEVELTWRTPSMLAAYRPVDSVQSAAVYLPGGADWYDFWSGERFTGGREVPVPSPVDMLPLFVRAGSIVPMGPHQEFAGQKRQETLEIRVYPGSNGTFVLFEDQGDGYGYEQGLCSEIAFSWQDRPGILNIGSRKGSFPGMIRDRVFRICRVGKGYAVGGGLTAKPTTEVHYTGETISVRIDR